MGIHGTGIFTTIKTIQIQPNVGKYIPYMDPWVFGYVWHLVSSIETKKDRVILGLSSDVDRF